LLNHLLSILPSQQDVRHPGNSGVAFLDLDPGQPEYSTPGHIYLAHIRSPVLGPSFSHPTLYEGSAATTVRSHYIGFLSPKDDSDHYCEAIMDLMDHFHQLRQQYAGLPLIINYPGWIFGQGLEIASWLVTSLGLSDLVYMSEKGPEEVVATLGAAASQNGVSMAVLPSQPIDYVSRSSSQLRSMQMLSYFHSSLGPSSQAPIWSNIPLARSRSFTVDYSGHKHGISLVLALGLAFDPDLLRDLLDGAVVGLVAVEDLDAILGSLESGQEDSVTDGQEIMDVDGYDANDTSPSSGINSKILRTKEGLPYPFMAGGICIPPESKLSYSLGQAIVRSINSDAQTLDLITPIPLSVFRTALDQGHQLILVRGQVDSPNWAIGEEYFAASAALARHRRGVESQGGQDENTKPGLPPAEDLAARKAADSMMATKLRERIRRASNVPFMRPVGWEDDSKPPSRRKDKRLWKLRKRVNNVRDSPVGDI
jgi:polynucleotide 5'-hydroxyl-kinase GRC3/NOL9